MEFTVVENKLRIENGKGRRKTNQHPVGGY